MDVCDIVIPPSTDNMAVQASDVSVATHPTIGSSLAQPRAGDIQEDLRAQDAADIRVTTAAPYQPTITVLKDQFAKYEVSKFDERTSFSFSKN